MSVRPLVFSQEDKWKSSTASYKPFHEAHSKDVEENLGIKTDEAKKFAESNYCRIKGVVAIWILDLIEEYMGKRGTGGRFKKEDMFTGVVNDKVRHNKTRQMFNCAHDWIMFFLIAAPVTLALAKHGLLHMVGSSQKRSAQVITYILSPKKPGNPKLRYQSWHEDFAHYLAEYFEHEWGLSVLIGGLDGSVVDVISGTYGGETVEQIQDMIKNGKFEKICLERGECLVMGGGLVHRGVGYVIRNSRLFVAFLGGLSRAASFFNTYNIDSIYTRQSKRKAAQA